MNCDCTSEVMFNRFQPSLELSVKIQRAWLSGCGWRTSASWCHHLSVGGEILGLGAPFLVILRSSTESASGGANQSGLASL